MVIAEFREILYDQYSFKELKEYLENSYNISKFDKTIILLFKEIKESYNFSKALIMEMLDISGTIKFKEYVLFNNLFIEFLKFLDNTKLNLLKYYSILEDKFEYNNLNDDSFFEVLKTNIDLFTYLIEFFRDSINKGIDSFTHKSITSFLKKFRNRIISCFERIKNKLKNMIVNITYNLFEDLFKEFIDNSERNLFERKILYNLMQKELRFFNSKLMDQILPKKECFFEGIFRSRNKTLLKIGEYFIIEHNYKLSRNNSNIIHIFENENKIGYFISLCMKYENEIINTYSQHFNNEELNEILRIKEFYFNLINNTQSKVLVFDLETTGLNIYDHIVEMAICELDLENGNIKTLFNSIIKPNNFNSSYKDSWIFHNSKLTYEKVLNGIPLDYFLPYLQSILLKYKITSFNLEFDSKFLRKSSLTFDTINCIMLSSMKFVKIPHEYYRYKFPKLSEAFDYFFPNEDSKTKHNALGDTIQASKILYELYKKNVYEVCLRCGGINLRFLENNVNTKYECVDCGEFKFYEENE